MRGPLWNRHATAHAFGEEGGMEHLETDVMRFMAILAFCLVAIFALVQSLPLQSTVAKSETATPVRPDPPPVPPAAATPSPEPPPPLPATPSDTPPPVSEQPTTPSPVAEPTSEEALVFTFGNPRPPRPAPKSPTPLSFSRPPVAAKATVVTTPLPEQRIRVAPAQPPPPASLPAPTPPTAPPTEAPTQTPASTPRGFTLRFDSAAALRQLIARDQVALYALTGRKAWRAMLVDERLSFRPTQTPTRFHEMATETVPGDVVRTLRRLVTVSPDALTWGVTLPPTTTRELSQFISTHDSGGLVIDAGGGLRLEQG